MAAVQSRQKSYADKRRRTLEFQVGDYVHLKVSPIYEESKAVWEQEEIVSKIRWTV